jgi:ABC-type amino acid transport substrate-binding protein
MIALISSGQADIGIGDFTATTERSHVVDFIDTVEFSRQVNLALFNLRSLILK